jgi:hypothetical protein
MPSSAVLTLDPFPVMILVLACGAGRSTEWTPREAPSLLGRTKCSKAEEMDDAAQNRCKSRSLVHWSSSPSHEKIMSSSQRWPGVVAKPNVKKAKMERASSKGKSMAKHGPSAPLPLATHGIDPNINLR